MDFTCFFHRLYATQQIGKWESQILTSWRCISSSWASWVVLPLSVRKGKKKVKKNLNQKKKKSLNTNVTSGTSLLWNCLLTDTLEDCNPIRMGHKEQVLMEQAMLMGRALSLARCGISKGVHKANVTQAVCHQYQLSVWIHKGWDLKKKNSF